MRTPEMKCHTLPLLVLFVGSCDQPLRRAADLEGCYYAAGKNPVMEIKRLSVTNRYGNTVSRVVSLTPSRESSIIGYDPPIMLADDPRKSLTVVAGDQAFMMAFTRGGTTHILSGGAFPVELIRKTCFPQGSH
jgi:hypothetical protein